MPQNLISLTLTDADHAAIADPLSTLESKLSGLISLSADERRRVNKMGEKSETFCRRTLVWAALKIPRWPWAAMPWSPPWRATPC